MSDFIYVLPVFVLLLVIEFAYGLYKKRNTYEDVKDTVASLSLGIMQVFLTVVTSSALLALDYFFYEHRIFQFGHKWFEIALLFIIMDFSFYWWHRASHRIRFFWANHVNHHSSTKFNFSTALRQPVFSPVLRPLFYFYIPWMGFDPKLIVILGIVSLVWAVWSHTQHIGKLGILEWIIVTPSNHRVHHGTNPEYIDKNYGGVFIFWDLLFGTFEPEVNPVKYGITKDIQSYHPIKIIFHEWWEWIKDLSRSRSLHDVYKHTFGPPQ